MLYEFVHTSAANYILESDIGINTIGDVSRRFTPGGD
jgi:hypothetical protein